MAKCGIGKLALGSGIALALGFALVWSRSPEAVVAAGYAHPLPRAETTWDAYHGANVWLSGLGEPSSGLRRALAIGDRITIRSEVYEVVGLEQIDGDPAGLGLGQNVRMQVVTARAEDSSEVVRLLIAVEAAPPAPITAPDRKVL